MQTPSELRETDVTPDDMGNEDYSPSDTEDDVLDVLRDEWKANPYLIREQTGHGKGAVNTALTRLTSAGWVRQVTRGLYEFVDDPRTAVSYDTLATPAEKEGLREIDEEVEEVDMRDLENMVKDLTGTVDDATEKAEETIEERREQEIEDALRGWSYGRGEDEQEANHKVAKKSLGWLRDEGGDEVKQEDAPLDQLVNEDPMDRKGDTLWRSVVRGAWQHAAGKGYVEQPHSRAYTWVGQ